MPFEEVLRSRHVEILQLFVEQATEAARGQPLPPEVIITEHVPSLLHQLATALETRRTTPIPARVAAQQHAEIRWHQGMDARSLVREYALLRACALEIAGHPSAEDLAVIDRFFNSATSEAVAQYVTMADAQAAALRATLEQENQELAEAKGSLALLFETARRERARAEEATRAKDEFLAVVSHELRTPLNSILGWSRLLRDRVPDAERLERGLEVIDRNATHQAQLISDLLDVSRIVTGAVRLEMGSVDFATVVEMAVASIAPAAEAKAITVKTTLEPGAGLLRGDATRLQQIVWNLLTNAVKFTPKHGWVRIGLTKVASDLELVVEDSGAGIDPAMLPFLFERFRQEDASVVRAFGGLGLGLSIARHLVELHGGTIAAQSPGKGLGTTFTVRLPVSPVASAPNTRPALTPRDPAEPMLGATKVDGMRVLVVEDQADARELLVELLNLYGVQTRSADTVAAGFEEFRRFRPDVVLSDIGLPGEDGYALARKVRALTAEAGGNTPMVALTAFSDAASRARAMTEGFSAHLGKPVESSDLFELLGSLRSPSSGRSRQSE